MTCHDKQHAMLAEFVAEHEWTLLVALEVYIRRMTGSADQTQASYDAIKDDPEKRAAQDQTIITTNGLRQAAAMFRDTAAQAEQAHRALVQLTQGDGDQEGEGRTMSTMRRATITRTNPTGPPTFVQVERYLGDGYRIIGRPAGFIIIGGEDAGDVTLDAILKRLAADGITVHEIAPCDPQCNGPHELTRNQLEEVPDGTVLWYDKLPVRRVHRDEGDITLHDGTLTWFSRPGELTWEPRPGLGHRCSRGATLPHGETGEK